MKKTALSIGLIGLALGLVRGPAAAQEKKDETLSVKGSLAAGVQAVKEVERSSKSYEYRDVPRGTFVPFLSLDLTKGARYLYLEATNLAQRDQRFLAGFGHYRTFSLDFRYDETPHRFSFDARPGNGKVHIPPQAGKDIINCESPSWPQDSPQLTIKSGFVLDIHCRVLGPDDVKCAIRKREVDRVAMPEGDQGVKSEAPGKAGSNPAIILAQIEPCDAATKLFRKIA